MTNEISNIFVDEWTTLGSVSCSNDDDDAYHVNVSEENK